MVALLEERGQAPARTRRGGITAGWHGPLTHCAAVMAVLALAGGVGLLVDPRTVLGESVWLKPVKFALSFSLYAGTLAWMMSRVRRLRRSLWWLGTVTVAGFVVPEFSAIAFQAARGVRSHFNLSTTLDGTVYMVMGGAAYLGWLLTLAMGVLLTFQRRVDRVMAWAVPLGVAVSLAGMSVGYLMTAPTPDQARAMAGGLHLVTVGAHSVGGPDGGAGMPLTGWATGAGDLRVAHFVGLHALQALPLLAIGLRLLARRFSVLAQTAVRVRLVVVGACGYAGLTGLLVWQARRGLPLVAPDAATWGAAAALAALLAMAAAAVLAAGRRAGRDTTS
ncbi:hypothetical protein [Nonomuraea pusilla]|uniref:Uncharacterized protein n=1 Tax=Nonomuraea pusilla TaxID=46177 RepID=A0A1H7ZZI2_9ACTN|nr:hypothetical protein [Nonomuraea pusilla]SEM62919.1 hypothetical protein SAMN05660976_05663 [Nonomuraea pusilla]